MSFSLILNITILSYHPQVIKMGEKHKGHVHVMLCVIYCTQILICLQDLPLEHVCKNYSKTFNFSGRNFVRFRCHHICQIEPVFHAQWNTMWLAMHIQSLAHPPNKPHLLCRQVQTIKGLLIK